MIVTANSVAAASYLLGILYIRPGFFASWAPCSTAPRCGVERRSFVIAWKRSESMRCDLFVRYTYFYFVLEIWNHENNFAVQNQYCNSAQDFLG